VSAHGFIRAVKCLECAGFSPWTETHAAQEHEHNFNFLIGKGLNTRRPATLRGLFSNHEAAVTVDPTMAHRLQGLLAFPGVSRVFPADAALGLSGRIISEKNTAVNRIFGRGLSAKRYILTNKGSRNHSHFAPDFAQNALVRSALSRSRRAIPQRTTMISAVRRVTVSPVRPRGAPRALRGKRWVQVQQNFFLAPQARGQQSAAG
jgi:hypothetical protein